MLLVLPAVPVSGQEQPSDAVAEVYARFSKLQAGALDQAAASEFFRFVQQKAGAQPMIHLLREMKTFYRARDPARWDGEHRPVEQRLMKAIQEAVIEARAAAIDHWRTQRAEEFRSFYGIGDIGSWKAAEAQLDFSMDVDWTLFGVVKAWCDPGRTDGFLGWFRRQFHERLGVEPTQCDVVATATHWEAEADVYTTRGGRQWAQEHMKEFSRLDPRTGRLVRTEAQYIPFEARLTEVMVACPELFDASGHLKKLTREELAEALGGFGRLDFFKTTAEHATGMTADCYNHFYKEGVAPTNLSGRKKIERYAKYGFRSAEYYRRGMAQDLGDLRLEVLGADNGVTFHFLNQFYPLKEQAADAQEALATFLAEHNLSRGEDPAAQAACQPRLAELQARAQAAHQAYEAMFTRTFGRSEPTPAQVQAFEARVEGLLRRQAQVCHLVRLRRILRLPSRPALREQLTAYRNDLARVQETITHDRVLQWYLKAVNEVLALERLAEREHFEGIGKVLERLETLFKRSPEERQALLEALSQSDLGRKLHETFPTFLKRPETPKALVLSEAEFGTTSQLLDELFQKPGALAGKLNHSLMYVDAMLGGVQIFLDKDMKPLDKFRGYAHLLVTLKFPVLYLLPAGVEAFTAGDNEALAKFIGYLLVPESMIPEMLGAIGAKAAAITTTHLFDSQLEALYLCTTFAPPADRTPPEEWRRNHDLVRYEFQYFEVNDRYHRPDAGQPTVSTYIDRLAANDFSEVGSGFRVHGDMGDLSTAVREALNRAIPKAVRAILVDGQHALFREDPALAMELQNLREIDDELALFVVKSKRRKASWHDHDDYAVRVNLVTNTVEEGQDLAPAVRAVVGGILQRRRQVQERVRERLAWAIVRTFETRKRAEVLRDLKLLAAMLNELDEIARTLRIEPVQALSTRLWQEMAGRDPLGANAGGVREKTADQWLQAYRQIKQRREALGWHLERLGIRTSLASDRDWPLTGNPVLRLVPEHDLRIAQKAQADFPTIGEDMAAVLQTLKGTRPEAQGEDQTNLRKLSLLRYKAMLAEFWLRGPNGAAGPVWVLVDAPVADEAFAAKVVDQVQAALDKPPAGWPGTYDDKLAELREAARAYNQLVNRLRVEYALCVEPSPATLMLKQGESKTLVLKARHPQAQVQWSLKQVDTGLVSVSEGRGTLAGAEAQAIQVQAKAGLGGETRQTVLGVKLLYDILRQHPDVAVDPATVTRTIEIPVVINPPATTAVQVRVCRQIGGERTTEPVDGAQVTLRQGALSRDATAQGQGRHRLEQVLPGQYTLVVAATGYDLAAGQDLSVVIAVPDKGAQPAPVDKTVYLTPRTGSLGVLVMAADPDGSPITGAQVKLSAPAGVKHPYAGFAGVDGRGAFTFENLLPGTYQIVARADHYLSPRTSESVVVKATEPGPPAAPPLRMVLEPIPSDVTVRVTDSGGTPKPGVRVVLADKAALTGADGKALFTGVLPSFKGPYRVTASLAGYPTATRELTVLPRTPEDRVPDVVLVLEAGRLDVTVRDAETNETLAGANVRLEGPSNLSGQSDAAGRVTFRELGAGEHTVVASKPGYTAARDTVVKLGLDNEPLVKSAEVRLTAGLRLQVYVEDEAGTIITPSRIWLDDQAAPGLSGSALFERVSPRSRHTVRAAAAAFSEETVEVAFSEEELGRGLAYRRVRLKPAVTLTVEVREEGPGGPAGFVPVPAKIVVTGPGIARPEAEVRGTATWHGLREGTYQAGASAPGYTSGSGSITVRYADEKRDYRLAVGLKKLYAVVHATVQVDVLEGKAVPTVTISCSGAGTATGPQATFQRVAPGPCLVTAGAEGYQSDSRKVTLAPAVPGEVVEIGLAIAPIVDPETLKPEELQKLVDSALAKMTSEEAKVEELKKLYESQTISKADLEKSLKAILGDDAAEKELVAITGAGSDKPVGPPAVPGAPDKPSPEKPPPEQDQMPPGLPPAPVATETAPPKAGTTPGADGPPQKPAAETPPTSPAGPSAGPADDGGKKVEASKKDGGDAPPKSEGPAGGEGADVPADGGDVEVTVNAEKDKAQKDGAAPPNGKKEEDIGSQAAEAWKEEVKNKKTWVQQEQKKLAEQLGRPVELFVEVKSHSRGVPAVLYTYYIDADGKQKRHGIYYEWTPEGRLVLRTPYVLGKRDGVEVRYWSHGPLWRVTHWKDDQQHGPDTDWTDQGQLHSMSTYQEGRKNGPYFVYDHGRLHMKGAFRNDQEDGRWTTWYTSSGRVCQVSERRAGQLHGLCIQWDDNGHVRQVETLQEGIRDGRFCLWYPNGRKQAEGLYDAQAGRAAGQSCETGLWRYWREDGSLERTAEYKAGKRHGKTTAYARDGRTVQEVTHYVDGRRVGLSTEYWPDGKKRQEIVYEPDGRKGLVSGYRPDGSLEKQGRYRKDSDTPCGPWKYWDAAGKLTTKDHGPCD